MGDVVNGKFTARKLAPSKVLEGAVLADLEDVMVIGWSKKGELYLAVSTSSRAELLYMLEKAKGVILDDQS